MHVHLVLMLIGPRMQFIKQQDKLFKEEHAKSAGGIPSVRLLAGVLSVGPLDLW